MDRPWINHYDRGVPAHLEYPEIVLSDYLRQSARKYPDIACTIFNDHSISFAKMDKMSDQLARALQSLGIKKDDRVGILLANIPQFVLAFYAILKAGAVVVALNPQYKQRELEYQIEDSGLQVLITLEDSGNLLDLVQANVQPFKRIYTTLADAITLGTQKQSQEKSLSFTDNTFKLVDLLDGNLVPQQKLPTVEPDDVAIFQYSGGTTGTPKAAVGTHHNLVANTTQFRAWLVGLQDGKEIVLAAIPLYHVYGMVIAMSLGVALGASLVLIPNPRDLEDLLGNIERYRPTLFPGVPSLYASINRHPEVAAGKYYLGSIKACISGSAPLMLETKEKFEALTGGKLMEGYGLSEAPTATHCNPMFGENRTGSIGLPLPDVDCRIVDLDKGRKEMGIKEIGELVIKGPQVMRGYHQRPEEDKITLVDGWLHTGDIAWMDEDGYFYLVDRKKELIKIGGFQVWPREIEEVIGLHPAVKEVAVSGVPDTLHGEAVKAWVVLNPGIQATVDEIRSWCSQNLVNYKVPALVTFCEELPRTTVGKVLRRELRRLHIEGLA